MMSVKKKRNGAYLYTKPEGNAKEKREGENAYSLAGAMSKASSCTELTGLLQVKFSQT
jgi:hypothetical protein